MAAFSDLRSVKVRHLYRRFPFNQNVRLEFSVTSSTEWNSFFQNFQKRGQPFEVYPNVRKIFSRKFSFHPTLLPEFLEFSVEWLSSHFGSSTVSEISGHFSWISCTICHFFQTFDGKHPNV